MINSTFDPSNIREFEKSKLMTNDQSAQGQCPAGQTANVDLTLTDDHLLTGIQILAKNSSFGDTITLQIVDVDGNLPNGMSYPPGSVLSQFATNLGVGDDEEEKINERSEYPAKLLAGMTIRVSYHSKGASPVDIIANYILHKVLV